MKPDYNKLIFWILGALSLIMTTIGSSAANHLVAQMDIMSIDIASLKSQNSTLNENKVDTERRLQRIEDKLDIVGLKQKFLEGQ